jgi:hypothetical protein
LRHNEPASPAREIKSSEPSASLATRASERHGIVRAPSMATLHSCYPPHDAADLELARPGPIDGRVAGPLRAPPPAFVTLPRFVRSRTPDFAHQCPKMSDSVPSTLPPPSPTAKRDPLVCRGPRLEQPLQSRTRIAKDQQPTDRADTPTRYTIHTITIVKGLGEDFPGDRRALNAPPPPPSLTSLRSVPDPRIRRSSAHRGLWIPRTIRTLLS